MFDSYASYLNGALPESFRQLYFNHDVSEFYSDVSKLRWYSPATLGDGSYYAHLAKSFSWYYSPNTWDKQAAVQWIVNRNQRRILEIGSGKGDFLELLSHENIDGAGIEINQEAIRQAKARGLNVTLQEEISPDVSFDVLCLFQVIEHVLDPKAFLMSFIEPYKPKYVILSAPCWESLLGHTSDPLSWPPHHTTAWSEHAFSLLAKLLNYRVIHTDYQPVSYNDLNDRLQMEGSRKLPGIPYIPVGKLGKLVFKVSRMLGKNWAKRGHSILVILERCPTALDA